MKILIIEDEHKIANSIKKALEHERYIVDVAYEGMTGYDLAVSESYDVIILDRLLPGMDGIEISTKLRANAIHIPLIMLTAKEQLEDQKNEEYQEDEDVDGDGQVVPFDFVQELVNNEKANIKNLLMTSQVRRQKQADVIVKARKL